METPYLDSQLKGYRELAKSGKMPESGMQQLRELEAIKKALIIHSVMQSCGTPDSISKHLGWENYEHMMLNEENIDKTLKESINMTFYLCDLVAPFYSA